MKVFKAFIKPFKATQRSVKLRAGFEREELIQQNLKCLLKVYCKNILSLSEEIHLSISEPEDKNLLREMHVCGKLVLFCFSTLKFKYVAYLSLQLSVYDYAVKHQILKCILWFAFCLKGLSLFGR